MKTIINPEKLKEILKEIVKQINYTTDPLWVQEYWDRINEAFIEEQLTWIPTNGEDIFVVHNDGAISHEFYNNGWQEHLEFGVIFKTESEAIETRDAIKKLLQERK